MFYTWPKTIHPYSVVGKVEVINQHLSFSLSFMNEKDCGDGAEVLVDSA